MTQTEINSSDKMLAKINSKTVLRVKISHSLKKKKNK